MRWLLGGLLLLAPLIGHAGALEDAALEAFREIQHMAHHEIWEYGGIVIERNGHFMYPIVPRTDSLPDTVNISIPKLEPGDRLAATYHTHTCFPKQYWTYLYSINDLMQSAAYGVPNIMLDQCSGAVHEFWFGVDSVWASGQTVTNPKNNKKVHLPAGRIVGHL
jgi:hypothetical protein